MMIERRKYARLNIELDVRYRIIGQKEKSDKNAKCNNISPEGLCLTFSNAGDIKKGTRLEIEVKLKNNDPFVMVGEIMWINSSMPMNQAVDGSLKGGIKILEIHNNDKSRFLLELCDHMVQKLNKEYPPCA